MTRWLEWIKIIFGLIISTATLCWAIYYMLIPYNSLLYIWLKTGIKPSPRWLKYTISILLIIVSVITLVASIVLLCGEIRRCV